MTRNRNTGNPIRWSYLILSIILWSIVIGWMWVIFLFSSESGFASFERSQMLLEFMDKHLNVSISHFILRKAAHFIEYAILTLLSFSSFAASSRISAHNPLVEIPVREMISSFQTNALLSIWITVLFAVIDEYHQIFVYGRNASVIDVLIGIAGGILILLLLRLSVFILTLPKKRSDSSDLQE
ncbi:MAG: VanZ family protein [Clostridiaceae bacterium]|nr:VanZ family protein [Clostridiaceae bacterium]